MQVLEMRVEDRVADSTVIEFGMTDDGREVFTHDDGEMVTLKFRAGEVWNALNVAAREMGVTLSVAMTGTLAYGLLAQGYSLGGVLLGGEGVV